MLQFLVVRAVNGDVAAVEERLAQHVPDALLFHPAEILVQQIAPETVLAVASDLPFDEVDDGGVAIEPDLALVHVGRPTVGSSGFEASAVLLEDVRRDGLASARQAWGGHVGVVVIDRTTGRVRAASDVTGLQPLFWRRRRGVVAAGAHQRLLHAATDGGGRIDIDPMAAADLQWQANLFADRGSLVDVRHLKAHQLLEVAPDGTDRVVVDEDRPWRSEAPGLDELTERLVEGAGRALSTFGSARLSLTGGFDSRLVLALALAAGHDGDIRTFTVGDQRHEDVVVATEVAARAGVEHERHTPLLARSDAAAWEALEQHPARYDGAVCPWDGLVSASPEPRQRKIDMSGLGGELLGVLSKRYIGIRHDDVGEALAFFDDYQQPADPLAVLLPSVRERQREESSRWMHGLVEDGVGLDDVDLLAYVQYRLPLWSGIIASGGAGANRVFPLLHPMAARAAFQAGRGTRERWRLHAEIMRRTAPQLLEIPFASAAWPEHTREALALDRAAPHEGSGARRTWKDGFIERQAESLWDVVLSSPSSPLFDVVDRRRVAALAGSTPTGIVAQKALLSLVGSQLAMSGIQQPPRDERSVPAVIHAREHLRPVLEQAVAAMTGTVFDTVLYEARAARGRRRSLLAHAVARVPDAQLADVVGGDLDVAGQRLAIAADLRFTIPPGGVSALRLDPRHDPGTIAIRDLRVRVGDHDHRVDPSRLDLHRALAHERDGWWILTCEDDPQIRVPADDLDLGAGGELRLSVLTADDVTVEFFWDDGSGFAADHRDEADVGGVPLGALVFSSLGAHVSDASGVPEAPPERVLGELDAADIHVTTGGLARLRRGAVLAAARGAAGTTASPLDALPAGTSLRAHERNSTSGSPRSVPEVSGIGVGWPGRDGSWEQLRDVPVVTPSTRVGSSPTGQELGRSWLVAVGFGLDARVVPDQVVAQLDDVGVDLRLLGKEWEGRIIERRVAGAPAVAGLLHGIRPDVVITTPGSVDDVLRGMADTRHGRILLAATRNEVLPRARRTHPRVVGTFDLSGAPADSRDFLARVAAGPPAPLGLPTTPPHPGARLRHPVPAVAATRPVLAVKHHDGALPSSCLVSDTESRHTLHVGDPRDLVERIGEPAAILVAGLDLGDVAVVSSLRAAADDGHVLVTIGPADDLRALVPAARIVSWTATVPDPRAATLRVGAGADEQPDVDPAAWPEPSGALQVVVAGEPGRDGRRLLARLPEDARIFADVDLGPHQSVAGPLAEARAALARSVGPILVVPDERLGPMDVMSAELVLAAASQGRLVGVPAWSRAPVPARVGARIELSVDAASWWTDVDVDAQTTWIRRHHGMTVASLQHERVASVLAARS